MAPRVEGAGLDALRDQLGAMAKAHPELEGTLTLASTTIKAQQEEIQALQGETIESTNNTVAELRSQVEALEQACDNTSKQAGQYAKEKQEEIKTLQAELLEKGETFESIVAELCATVEQAEQFAMQKEEVERQQAG